MRQRLSVVNVGVEDVQRARNFYVNGMGLPERPESRPEAVWVEMNKTWIGFFKRDRLDEMANDKWPGQGIQGITLSIFVESKEEVDQILNQAEKAGGRIVKPARDSEDSQGRGGYFADPDNLRWEVSFSPRWPDLCWPDGKPDGAGAV